MAIPTYFSAFLECSLGLPAEADTPKHLVQSKALGLSGQSSQTVKPLANVRGSALESITSFRTGVTLY